MQACSQSPKMNNPNVIGDSVPLATLCIGGVRVLPLHQVTYANDDAGDQWHAEKSYAHHKCVPERPPARRFPRQIDPGA
jgi:hypothetical protein